MHNQEKIEFIKREIELLKEEINKHQKKLNLMEIRKEANLLLLNKIIKEIENSTKFRWS